MDMLEEDLLPEYLHYRDEGCELAPSCLNCSFSRCIYEESRGKQRHLKELRNNEIYRLFYSEHQSVKEIAQRFGVSQRTVQRVVRKFKGEIRLDLGAKKE